MPKTKINRKGLLFVMSAPSGSGKTTIAGIMHKQVLEIHKSVSYTTRKIRENEIDGKDYHFISKETFDKMIKNNEFIEWANVHQNYYGTPLKETRDMLNSGKDIFLTIDVQGACHLKNTTDIGVYIFLLPPSFSTSRERLKKRGDTKEDEIESRLKEAFNELKKIDEFEYIVVNDSLDEAVKDVKSIISAERSRKKNLRFKDFIANIYQ